MNQTEAALLELNRRVTQLEERLNQIQPQDPPAPAPTLTPFQIVQRKVAREYGISVPMMLCETRRAGVVEARHVAMFICHSLSIGADQSIADAFCRKDRTTVLHAIHKISDRRSIDRPFDARVSSLRNWCEAGILSLRETSR